MLWPMFKRGNIMKKRATLFVDGIEYTSFPNGGCAITPYTERGIIGLLSIAMNVDGTFDDDPCDVETLDGDDVLLGEINAWFKTSFTHDALSYRTTMGETL